MKIRCIVPTTILSIARCGYVPFPTLHYTKICFNTSVAAAYQYQCCHVLMQRPSSYSSSQLIWQIPLATTAATLAILAGVAVFFSVKVGACGAPVPRVWWRPGGCGGGTGRGSWSEGTGRPPPPTCPPTQRGCCSEGTVYYHAVKEVLLYGALPPLPIVLLLPRLPSPHRAHRCGWLLGEGVTISVKHIKLPQTQNQHQQTSCQQSNPILLTSRHTSLCLRPNFAVKSSRLSIRGPGPFSRLGLRVAPQSFICCNTHFSRRPRREVFREDPEWGNIGGEIIG